MYNVSYYSEKNVRYQLLNEQLHQQLHTYYTHITRQVRSDFCLFQTSIKITINNIKKESCSQRCSLILRLWRLFNFVTLAPPNKAIVYTTPHYNVRLFFTHQDVHDDRLVKLYTCNYISKVVNKLKQMIIFVVIFDSLRILLTVQ